MTDYTRFTTLLSRFHPLTFNTSKYRDTIHEQLFTIITTPSIPPTKLNFLILVLTVKGSHLHGAELRMFNKPKVDGRHSIGLDYSAGEEEFVVHSGSEKERYEDVVESFVSVVESYGMAYLRKEVVVGVQDGGAFDHRM
jgi:hypothetical protein